MKRIMSFLLILILHSSFFILHSKADEVMTKEGDTYIVNTTTLCSVKGFKDVTPLEVYIEKGKVVKVKALKNHESKGYFQRVTKTVLPKYASLKVSKAKKLSSRPAVDGFTGATYSTRAVQANINAALKYYQEHK